MQGTHRSAQGGGAATGPPRPHRPRPAPAAPRRVLRSAPTSRQTDPARHGWAPAPPTSSANTPSPSLRPATAWPCADARTRPAPRCREPKIALHDLTRFITRPPRRVRQQVQRPQLRDPAAERADRVRPAADPFGDHRRRHPRIRRQQLPDPRLKPIHQRPPGARRYFGGPSLASAASTVFLEILITRAISEIGMPSRPPQPADLCPVLPSNTCLPPRLGSSQGLGEAGQFSVATRWSVFSCRRHAAAPSLATVHPVGVEHDVLTGCYLPSFLWVASSGRRREGDAKMTELRVGRGIGHRRAAALMPPRCLQVFPPVWWPLGGWPTGSPVAYGLTGSVAGGPEPRVRVRGRNTAAGPGGGAAPWGASVAPPPLFPPVEPAPAASAESREHSRSSAPATRKRVVLLPHAPIEPTDTRTPNRRTPE